MAYPLITGKLLHDAPLPMMFCKGGRGINVLNTGGETCRYQNVYVLARVKWVAECREKNYSDLAARAYTETGNWDRSIHKCSNLTIRRKIK